MKITPLYTFSTFAACKVSMLVGESVQVSMFSEPFSHV